MIQVSFSVFVCIFIILIGPFITVFNIVMSVISVTGTRPFQPLLMLTNDYVPRDSGGVSADADADAVFPYLESVIHLAQMQCILSFETSWRSLVMLQDKNHSAKKTGLDASECSKDYSLSIYSTLLKNEILGAQFEDYKESPSSSDSRLPLQQSAENRNLFSYRPRHTNIINEPSSPYSLTPVSSKSVKSSTLPNFR